MDWAAIWKYQRNNWRSSAQAVLTVLIALGTYYTVTPSSVLSQKTVMIVTLNVGALKVLLGLLQADAKKSS